MEAIEAKLDYSFKNRGLLVNALTHSSYANENRGRSCESNERLEFLGDSVLGLVVADALYRRFPDMPEGRMTRMRAQLVCEESLHHVASKLGLGEYMRLGRGEEHTGGRSRTSILADAVEALIAAMYLDGSTSSPHSTADMSPPATARPSCRSWCSARAAACSPTSCWARAGRTTTRPSPARSASTASPSAPAPAGPRRRPSRPPRTPRSRS